jgi:putative lipoprotein (rSAM/lipoprotein system)
MADTAYTDSNGKYAFTFTNIPDESLLYELKAEDIDGVANGGPFITEEATASLAEATWDKSHAKGWYSGKATIVKDIKLTK